LGKRRKWSALFFFFDGLADDVGYVGVAFFLFLDEGRIVQALVANLDFFLFAGRGRLGGSRLLALLFGLGVLERNKFGVGGTTVSAGAGAGRAGATGSARARGGVGAAIGTTLPVYGEITGVLLRS
jgi:hypothetical protein